MVELTKTDINNIVDGVYRTIREKYGVRPNSTKDEIRQDLEELCKHPKLKNITYKRGVLRFYTTELYINLDGAVLHMDYTARWQKQHPDVGLKRSAVLGEFEITQYIRSGRTRIRNLTNNVLGFDHPHITNGMVCFAQYAEIKNKLIRRLELAGYIELIFQFLNNYEPHHTEQAMLWLAE